jgi:predicted permease
VAIVNESLAKKYFAHTNPIGKTFEEGRNHPVTIEIVGVCADARYYRVRKEVEPTYYKPYWQNDGLEEATFVVRTSLAGEALLLSLRDAVRQVDPNLPLLDVRTQDEQIAANLRQERIFATLTTGFGVLAIVLACVGVYGVMAYSVTQRTNEIGIRMALGARPGRVLWMVLGEATWVVLIGVVAGIGAALMLARAIAAMLYGLKPWDPVTFVMSSVLLILAALGSSWIPARRAARAEPMTTLRHE